MNTTQNLKFKFDNASVCSDQPLATEVGLEILRKGGNAADAVIATFATVSIIQPFKCGIGGDIMCLFYNSKSRSVQQLNGSGMSGRNNTLEKLEEKGIKDPHKTQYSEHGLWVSIPGAVAAMHTILKNFGSGKLTMAEILHPAIQLTEKGVVIPGKAAEIWREEHHAYCNSENAEDFLINHNSPKVGETIRASKLSQCYKDIASSGKSFYEGSTAQRMVKVINDYGGNMTLDDFKEYWYMSQSQIISDAISIDFYGYRIWEMKPNTIGIVALVMLKVLQQFNLKALGHNSAEYIHIITEVTKLSFLECWDVLCDSSHCKRNVEDLLSDFTASKLKQLIDLNKAAAKNLSIEGGNTSYIAVVDQDGNGCSFIASISSFFGSGLIPKDCGFFLNDRLKCMSLENGSSNVYGPNKFPLHSIIPALVTNLKTDELLAVFGVTGRWMQPQGHVQVILNMIVFGMDPQTAVSKARFFVGKDDTFTEYKNELHSELCLEEGIDRKVIPVLESKGHNCKLISGKDRIMFGRGHAIAKPSLFCRHSKIETNWCTGVDPRSDGYPMGF